MARSDEAPVSLALLAHNLTSDERSRLAALLASRNRRVRVSWCLVNEGDAAVLVYGGDAPDTLPGTMSPPLATLQVVSVTRPARDDLAGGSLRRTHFRRLDFTLSRVEEQVLPQATAVPGTRRRWSISRRSRLRYRLHSWPSDDFMAQRPYHYRMAMLLTVRFTEAAKIAAACGISGVACEWSLNALKEGRWLIVAAGDADFPGTSGATVAQLLKRLIDRLFR